jgi:thiamine kinase-like enzyme
VQFLRMVLFWVKRYDFCMDNINLPKLSELFSKRIGDKIEFTGMEKIGSGYHSDGYKLAASNGKTYFLKHVRSHDLGFEFPERKISSLMVSTGMGKRAGSSPAPIGVFVLDEDHEVLLPEIGHNSKVFHLQEYGGKGTSYSEILEKNKDKKAVDEEDMKRLGAIADSLINIHSVKHPSQGKDQQNAVYNDGLRNMLIHPELSMMVLSEFPNDYKILDLEGQKEIIGLMYENIKAWMGRSDRLSALHGDFWGANIFFREDESLFIVDFSRIPWGDPAIDVGWFIAQYLWFYHETGNEYFKDLTEAWLDIYEKKSGDAEIRNAIALVIGWTGIVQIYPRWFPNRDVIVGTKFIRHVMEILRQKRFVWDK